MNIILSVLWLLICISTGHSAVTPYAYYRMGDGTPATNGGQNLPADASGNGRHLANAAAGTPVISASGGPSDDAYYTFSGSQQYFYGTTGAWDPPEDNVGVEVWVKSSNLSQVDSHVFGTGDNGHGLNLGYDAYLGRGWFGAVAGKAFVGALGTGNYSADGWLHLAVVRAGGTSTFYVNGNANGTSTVVPNDASGTGALRMAVDSTGTKLFQGALAEARVFTFAAGSFNPATDLLITPAPSQVVLETAVPTTAGTLYQTNFRILPRSGGTSVPPLRLEITGATPRADLGLLTALPVGASAVPYFHSFTADSASTTLRFSLVNPGDSAAASQIAGLQVAEPLTLAAATLPNARQQAQIDRRYGLFLHFGINTFHNQEWTDGSKPVSSYQPSALNVEQWVQTAYEAGMRYVIIIAKHHDGFCLWDSPWTSYDVGASPVTTDVIAAAAAACRNFGIPLAIYYSLWDRHEASYANDANYQQYLLRQLAELMGNHGPICELWLDGAWDKANSRWPSTLIYDLVRRLQPDCQVSTNWTIGLPGNPDHQVLPADQQAGYPLRYFPSDFRLGDPLLAKFPDPKTFSHNGNSHYLPFEATVTLSSANNWFFHTTDTTDKPVSQLAAFYESATAQSNVLVLNAPPDRSGRVRELERNTLFQLRDTLGLKAGWHLPKNVTGAAIGTASAILGNNVATYGPQLALDGNPDTRWASGPAGLHAASFELDLGSQRSFDRILIDEYEAVAGSGRITAFRLQAWLSGAWATCHAGTTCGRFSLHAFTPQTTSKVRLLIDAATDAPSIWEIQVQDAGHAYTDWLGQHFAAPDSQPACGMDGDPDHDGRSNLLEFALDDDPAAGTSSGKVGTALTSIAGQEFPVFTLPVRDGAVFSGSGPLAASIDGINYRIEAGTNLMEFSSPLVEIAPAFAAGRPAPTAGWSYRSFRGTTPCQVAPQAFMRAAITPAD